MQVSSTMFSSTAMQFIFTNARYSETTGQLFCLRQELGHSDSNPRHEDLSKLLRETLRGSYVIMPCHGRVKGQFQTQKGPLSLVERFVGVQEVVGWQFVHNPVVSCIGDLAADAAAQTAHDPREQAPNPTLLRLAVVGYLLQKKKSMLYISEYICSIKWLEYTSSFRTVNQPFQKLTMGQLFFSFSILRHGRSLLILAALAYQYSLCYDFCTFTLHTNFSCDITFL